MVVKFFATYRDITGCKTVDISEQPNVREMLRLLGERWPQLNKKLLTPDGHLGEDAIVMVNGRHIEHLEGIETPLRDMDVVAVFPVVAGG